MDPKQTEGQKSGPVPQTQGGFSFQTGTLSTGANIARTMNDLNANDRKSATVNSPFAKHHFDKVAPQTGDILIASPSPRPKFSFFSRKKATSTSPSMVASGYDASISENKGPNRGRLIQFGLILGGLALVGLVIFTVVMLVNQPKGSSGNGSSNVAVTGDPEELFGEYIQKLITGEVGKTKYEDSNGKTHSFTEVLQSVINTGTIGSNIMYADQIINNEYSDSRSAYIEELNDIFDSFSASYSGAYYDNLSQISRYYYDFAKIQPVAISSIIESYQNNGYDQAKENISNLYPFSDDRGITDYNTFSLEYALSVLNLINDANSKLGCNITSAEAVSSCVGLSSLEAYQAYINISNTYFINATQIKQDIRNNALELIGELYVEFYDISGEDINGEEEE